MRQFIHNTTAIAACLSLLAPDFAAAQMVSPPDQPALRMAQAENAEGEQPRRKRQAEEGRSEAQEKRREQRQEKRQERREQRQEARQEQRQEQRREERDNAEAEARQRERAERRQAQQPAGKEPAGQQERRTEERREKRAEERREQRAEERREERVEERREQRQETRQEERREQRQERLDRQELEAALAERERRDARRDDAQLEGARSSTARARAERMSGLDGVLAQELDRGLDDGDLRCLSGGRAPCADGDRLVTPEGVVVERNRNGRLQLAPADTQMYRVTRDGDIVQRSAEEGRRQTEASRQAARERAARRDFQALLDDRKGIRTERRITEENSRRSSEDFSTSLRDALAGRDRADRDDDDSGSDLTKALLLGLGAVAVGSMLNNNRQVALSSPDRVVVTRADGSQEIIKDETALLRQPGSTVTTEEFDDGSTRTIVTRADGSRVVTIRDADLRVLRRTLVSADGRTTRLIDDTQEVDPVDVATLPAPAVYPAYETSEMDEGALRDALAREAGVDRRFTLGQIRNIPEVRALVPPVDIDAITFDTGSSAIRPAQAEQLATVGGVIQDSIADNPQEMFLIEGHTDTVGSDAANLALSDRRAESVALALSEYYDVPPENLVVQGYGEQYLRVRSEGDIRENRRASVRRITDLLQTASE